MLRGNPCTNPVTRRTMLRLCCAASVSNIFEISQAQARSADLAAQLREAARRGAAVRLPPGEISLMGLELPDGAVLVGAPGRTVLKLKGVGPLLAADGASRIRLESLILDGGAGHVGKEQGLVDMTDVVSFEMRGCTIRRSPERGLRLLRSGGVIAQNTIEQVGDSALYSLDGLGLDIDGNTVLRCGDNGVMVWASEPGRYDGSRIRNNVIEDVNNRSGGDGPYGNGVSIYAAGSVRVEKNRVSRCAYSHIRTNATHNVSVIGNDCKVCGERSMYAEFGAKNAIFRDNRIEDSGAGIGVANSDRGTDGAVVSGNTIIRMRESHPDDEFGPQMLWLTGIEAEKNAQVIGNVIAGPGWIGIAMGGWRENVRVELNDISGVDYGIVFATGDGVGEGFIIRNRIRNVRKGAIVARAGQEFLPGDAGRSGAKQWPRLVVRENEVG
jgi:uncharacterized secreted repeat protein (TIGR03808 family)